MTPSLNESEEVITISYFFTKPKIGDIVVFRDIVPPFVFCKRITKIFNDKIWVEGDNKKISIDSRKFGYIEKSNIIGKVIIKL